MDFYLFFCEKLVKAKKLKFEAKIQIVNKQLKISKQKSKQTADKCKQIAEIVNKQLTNVNK